ncbi:MAG: dephospho-CoA kinase [Ignavibacteriales bacterium]|nr:dephospho-CoA kinase [Ignavibacteriales bacterium]
MTSSSKHILKIGITGGIGSGKSTVCSIFAHLGIPVLYADDLAKELSSTDSTVRKKLTTLLGESAFQTDGSLNRSFIASEIFSSKTMKQKVESIIHPRVEIEIERRMKELAQRGEHLVIVEAALIYEAGLYKKLDAVIVVDADESVRISRVRKRDVVSEDAVRNRMAAQLDVKKRLEKADYIIYNNGTSEELESKVRFLYSVFKQLADEGSHV